MTGPGRIGGPPPPERSSRGGGTEPAKGEFEKEMKKAVKKIEKVGETELDKQRKRPPFFSLSDEEDEMEEEGAGLTGLALPGTSAFDEGTPPPAPVGFADMEEQAVPPQEMAAPPSVSPFQAQPELGGEEDLPQSAAFYGEYDIPDQPFPMPQFQEQAPTTPSNDQPQGKKKQTDTGLLSPSTKMAKGGAVPSFGKKSAGPQMSPSPFSIFAKMGKDQPGSRMAEWETPPGTAVIGGQVPSEVKKEGALPSSMAKKGASPRGKEPTGFVTGIQKAQEKEEEMLPQGLAGEPPPRSFAETAREKEKRQAELGIVEPSTPALPTQAQEIALAAMPPSPYLSSQAASLFYQMVGTIYVMGTSTPGITTTEVLLNAEAFRDSVFFNSTITLQKYASAPDSFNVTLTGSSAAVKAFNANIDKLAYSFSAAYRENKINFRIGQIRAEERPLIRRKKGAGEKGPDDR